VNGCLVTGVNIIGNNFRDMNTEGIRLVSSGYVKIAGNLFQESNVSGSDLTPGFNAAINGRSNAANVEICYNTFLQTLTGSNQSPFAIRLVNDVNTQIHHNNFIKTNSGNGIMNFFTSHTNLKIWDNEGYQTHTRGATLFSGDNTTTAFNVTHNLGGGGQTVTPTEVIVTTNQNSTARVTAISSTTFTVTFGTAPANGTNNVTVYWAASKYFF
jgi:hypothetical protein